MTGIKASEAVGVTDLAGKSRISIKYFSVGGRSTSGGNIHASIGVRKKIPKGLSRSISRRDKFAIPDDPLSCRSVVSRESIKPEAEEAVAVTKPSSTEGSVLAANAI